jgi:hypothetical protein
MMLKTFVLESKSISGALVQNGRATKFFSGDTLSDWTFKDYLFFLQFCMLMRVSDSIYLTDLRRNICFIASLFKGSHDFCVLAYNSLTSKENVRSIFRGLNQVWQSRLHNNLNFQLIIGGTMIC